jgi:hypothetical protein
MGGQVGLGCATPRGSMQSRRTSPASPENADAKARSKSTSFGDASEGEEGVELDNESVEDATFIEATQVTDVAEIIGDDTEPDD